MPDTAPRTDVDWSRIADALAPVEVIDDPVTVKKRSRDFFWYSPILNAELRRSFGDLVVRPKTRQELAHVLAVAHAHGIPVTLRGGGTGNYGQAVPLQGGLIVETTAMNRILEIGEGFVRVEAGALMADINAALIPKGWEMAMFPSTQDIATIGGFVAGGSAGIGSVANGPLREKGNIIRLKVLSVEAAPVEHVFDGEEALRVHHAWGLNGAITEVTLRTVPTRDWVGCIAGFDSYRDAYSAGYALAAVPDAEIARKLCSVVDARIADFFPRLDAHVPKGRNLLVTLVPREHLEALRALVGGHDGVLHLAMDEAERQAAKLPHVFEFAYNHTTLQVLKSDRSATYQQIGVPDPADADRVARMRARQGEDVWPHHEFTRGGGTIYCADLPIVWFSTPERLAEINATYEADGFTVYDAHVHVIEGNHMQPDYRHLAWKKRLDPRGLLNPGKSLEWEKVRHLSADEIERLGPSGPNATET
ncbi:FAD-binding oxidoreductase [Roseibacterium sp. SDUM158016]|uniref:FAD-binding oxidoreductase n=1 Tax=Roseicyclus sediminis TaxID=2980997 RepID=UPI0021D0398F|nr:FAD-binding oxidoreductase [Roseibacterium sp. SDUM158016]MCU4652716.1 FAD-binding oxidoreductase [Roseibacterium sp. SDUM158016]